MIRMYNATVCNMLLFVSMHISLYTDTLKKTVLQMMTHLVRVCVYVSVDYIIIK